MSDDRLPTTAWGWFKFSLDPAGICLLLAFAAAAFLTYLGINDVVAILLTIGVWFVVNVALIARRHHRPAEGEREEQP